VVSEICNLLLKLLLVLLLLLLVVNVNESNLKDEKSASLVQMVTLQRNFILKELNLNHCKPSDFADFFWTWTSIFVEFHYYKQIFKKHILQEPYEGDLS
jgi:hypothetical protein